MKYLVAIPGIGLGNVPKLQRKVSYQRSNIFKGLFTARAAKIIKESVTDIKRNSLWGVLELLYFGQSIDVDALTMKMCSR